MPSGTVHSGYPASASIENLIQLTGLPLTGLLLSEPSSTLFQRKGFPDWARKMALGSVSEKADKTDQKCPPPPQNFRVESALRLDVV